MSPHKDRINATLFQHMIMAPPFPLIGSALGSLLTCIVLYCQQRQLAPLHWLLLVYVVVAVRLWLTKRFRRRLVTVGYSRRDALLFAFSTGLSGIAWGLVGLMLKGATPISYIMIITVIQAMVMGGVVTLGTFMPAFLSFTIPAVLPMAVVMAGDTLHAGPVMALYSLSFTALMSGIAWRFNMSLRRNWQLTFDKEDLVAALTEASTRLTVLAQTDGLTGLASRNHLDQILDVEFARHARSRVPLSLIMLDVDHFKLYNDTYGHVEGDQCLKKIAAVFGTLLHRAPDVAARYGGEEFLGVLPETDSAGAIALAEEIRSTIALLGIPHIGSATAPHVTVSLGVVTLDCSVLGSAAEAVMRADQQLYRAKSEGRNRIAHAPLVAGVQAVIGGK